MIKHACLLSLFATLLSLSGCGVDEFRNPQRKSREDCKRAGGEPITDKFCDLRPDAGRRDAAVSDASDDDAGPVDAGPIPCSGDEELSCYTQTKATYQQQPCQPGVRKCVDGFFGDCIGEVKPQQESCNGKDDDCDGTTDEIPSSAIVCPVEGLQGECAQGREVCDEGKVTCLQRNAPQSDVCDGKDNDCNGKIDEGTAVVCYPDDVIGCMENESGELVCVGTCRAGTKSCTDGEYEEACGGDVVVPANADVCPGAGELSGDEDCDGKVDEGCGCIEDNPCYTGPAATRDIGPCHAGTWSCSNATNGECVGEVKPEVETCGNPGVDDDCDGVLDDVPMLDTSCRDQSTSNGICRDNARWQCQNGVRTCVNGAMGAEVCDAQNTDEDCDGMANENFDVATDEQNCGACGVQCDAGLTCCDGRCVNTQTSNLNCSICGNACAAGQTCCSGGCVNTLNTPSDCGTCGHECTGLLKGCTNGVCTKLLL